MSIYCALMEEVKQRLSVIARFTQGATTLGREDFDAETICIHMRKSLEAIAFGSLVAHRAAYEAVHADIQSRWRAKEILDRVEKIHPKFYPEPMERQAVGSGQWHFTPLTTGFLTRADFVILYDKCGDALHLWSPFRASARVLDFGRSIDEWRQMIHNTLRFHVVWMSGTGDGWLVELERADDDRAHATVFAPAEAGSP